VTDREILNALRDDIRAIKRVVCGDETTGAPGHGERIRSLEKWATRWSKVVWMLVAAITVLLARSVWTLVFQGVPK